jgi:tetratricopeptide (TPR) repeat protein
MKIPLSLFAFAVSAAFLGGLLHPPLSPAAIRCDPWVARLVSVQGGVEARRAGQTQWEPARLNDTYCAGDRIQVGERSRADVALVNQPVLRLDQNTTITLGGIREERTSIVDLLRGVLYFFSRLPRNLEVRTNFVNAGVEGTEGLVIVDADRTLITIFEGRVSAANPYGSLTLTGGRSAVAVQGNAPVLTVLVRPRDAVRWAIYYPPALSYRPEDLPAGPGWQAMLRKSIEAYVKGDFQSAFESIRGVPDTVGEPRFFAYRASLLLAVGRVDEANRDLERALGLNPNYSDALALQSIVAVVQNEKEKALDLAQKAVAADPNSASGRIALSYAQQSNFDLESALASLQQAVQLRPETALAWARLAEVWLSFGRLDEALEAAKKAVMLNPDLSRTQTVLGFAYLTQVNTEDAKKALERAIELDQADPLPRLGLGLARLREGDLHEGRREIEIAVSLDPENALVRSYLGKAYFEEKRGKQAAGQYETSKKLDPGDPTSYFYDAILKQTANRPVEALQDMQKAIELNDNRAVYRSRQLLDSDLAARSASVGRIYSDLGFQQLALVEGWKSVNTDPANFSAHRLLADSYSILPRHEIARVSELLQSQLLQPLNMTPIQPSLAEANLFLISAGGPAALSFNEFHPLFTRNGITFQTTGLAGENGTYAGEGVLSGIHNKASFSLGGFHFQSNGWRKNSDQDVAIGDGFLQVELSPKTSVQAEYRYRKMESGELRLRFAPDDFRPDRRHEDETQSVRVGLSHVFTPNSRLLGNFTYQHVNRGERSAPIPFDVIDTLKGKDSAVGGELQYLFRSNRVNVVGGLGYFDVDSAETQTFLLFLPPDLIPVLSDIADTDARHTNLYLYSYTRLPAHVTLTLGASGDFLTRDLPGARRRSQFNPKFGITWNPLPDTTVRASAFRTLKRTLITNQTLEPTQVAGFNQFFDDFNATKAWRYGAAVDQKFPHDLYGGVEYAFRDLEVPFIASTDDGLAERRVDWREKLLRFYLFWTPHDWLAVSAGYHWERFARDRDLADGARHVETNRVPLGISVFHPSGFSASLKAIYTNQRGLFQRIGAVSFESGKDDFWTVDAAVNYRLPKRYGFITFGVSNLFDNRFKYFDTGQGSVNVNPRIMPDRVIYGRLTLAFP